MSKDFESELAKVAQKLIDHAIQENTPYVERIDAMKVLNQYYALRLKHKADDPDEDQSTFGDFTRELAEEENGSAQVRGHRRTRPGA